MAPSLAQIRSVPLVHGPREVFAPPMASNQWGEVQAWRGPSAYRLFTSPPYAVCEGVHAEIYVKEGASDDVYALGEVEAPTTYIWGLDRVERSLAYRGLEYRSDLVLPPGRDALLLRLRVRNLGPERRSDVRLFLRLLVGVERLATWATWHTVALPPARVEADRERHAFVCSGEGGAWAVQGSNQPSASYRASVSFAEWLGDANLDGIVGNTVRSPACYAGFEYPLDLGPGEEWELRFVHALAGSRAEALALYDAMQADFAGQLAAAEAHWAAELAAAFRPGNDRFSGHLPTLEGVPEEIERLYLTGLANLLFARRTGPRTPLGTVYKTISPRSGTTCWLWDTQQASGALALLDPAVLRRLAEWWMAQDVHRYVGTDYLAEEPRGPAYSVNDYAMATMIHEYVRWTGHRAWLEHEVAGRPVREHLRRYATHWRDLRRWPNSLLADYGEAHNLLECVRTYTHGVAAFNAANVWMNELVAAVDEARGEAALAAQHRAEADALFAAVQELYDPRGWWRARQPDGRDVPVKTCYDFGVVMHTLYDRLAPAQRAAMIAFFTRDLMTPTWMRALAADDPAAALSRRVDHTHTGAYASWPANGLLALARAGEHERAFRWAEGLGRTARQGPFGQGHFHGGEGSLMEAGGARKAPDDPPHYEEWLEVAGGMYVQAVIEALFGVRPAFLGGVQVEPGGRPPIAAYAPAAALRGLPCQGREYEVTAAGLRER